MLLVNLNNFIYDCRIQIRNKKGLHYIDVLSICNYNSVKFSILCFVSGLKHQISEY